MQWMQVPSLEKLLFNHKLYGTRHLPGKNQQNSFSIINIIQNGKMGLSNRGRSQPWYVFCQSLTNRQLPQTAQTQDQQAQARAEYNHHMR